MNYQLKGTIKAINETHKVSEKFQKREFVVTDNDAMYPQDIMFQLTQDKCDILNAYKVGNEVTVSFNLRGRAWTNPQGEVKYFNTLDAWRIEAAKSTPTSPEPLPDVMNNEDDDLPF